MDTPSSAHADPESASNSQNLNRAEAKLVDNHPATAVSVDSSTSPHSVGMTGDKSATSTIPAPTSHVSGKDAAHSTTAQKVFGGRSGASVGMMCNNLQSNPFSVKTEEPSSSTNILAKPKFSLKPSSFGTSSGFGVPSMTGPSVASGSLEKSSTTSSSATHATVSATHNAFLRPATLKYDDDEDHSVTAHSTNASSTDGISAADAKASSWNGSTLTTASSDSSSNVLSSATNPDALKGLEASGGMAGNFTFGNSMASRATGSFVFGSDLDSRVTNAAREQNGSKQNGEAGEVEKPKAKTLEEAAAEYKKEQESGPLLPEVAVFTGEEDESNVLQINCKLFFFDSKDNNWLERGRGLLRLNDDHEGKHSRIVVRAAGIHRVTLNTSIWPAMLCERANPRSVRLTASCDDEVQVYLVTGSPGDIEHLYSGITYRIQRLKQEETDSAATKRKNREDEQTSPKKARHDSGDNTNSL